MKAATRLPFLENLVLAVPRTPLVGGTALIKPKYSATISSDATETVISASSSGSATASSGTGLFAAKGLQDPLSGQYSSPLVHRGLANPGAAGALNGQVLIWSAWQRHREMAEKGTVEQPAQELDVGDLQKKLLYWDEECCLVCDAFPKSVFHFLVLPRDKSLKSLSDLRSSHVRTLKHMRKIGDAAVQAIQAQEDIFDDQCRTSPWGEQCVSPIHLKFRNARRTQTGEDEHPPANGNINRLRFMQGFHAIPSLPTIHLHVLSLDLCSAFMKKKKHYNSFTTPFFLTIDRMEADLQQHGSVTINRDTQNLTRFEKQPLQCVWCGYDLNAVGMPGLRSHLMQCAKNRSFLDI